MAIIDHHYKLAYWHDRRRTVKTIAAAVAVFILWDLLGIASGIFYAGKSELFLPIRIAPEFPIEEVFFLTLLCYCTLVIYQFGASRWPRI
jgi:lycopene cyclase domain-containing protein